MSAPAKNMQQLVAAFADQLEHALRMATDAHLEPAPGQFNQVVISGMGGSGIGGRIVSQLVSDKARIPVWCLHDYTLPANVGPGTLFIASSYSGDTEETLATAREALNRGAHVACITSGGLLARMAEVGKLNLLGIPPGNPPRSMLSYSLVQLLRLFQHYGISSHAWLGELPAAIALIRGEEKATELQAAEIAQTLHGHIPVLYTDTTYEAVAVRWRQQLNENAKTLCWHHTVPEMNHNELVGWSGGDQRFAAVFIQNADDHKRNALRVQVSRQVIEPRSACMLSINSKGATRLQRVLYLVHLGDWVSVKLAGLKGVNTMEIPAIDLLKSELAKVPFSES